jgi:predicted RNase H-like HicB family nuclease
LEEVIVPGKGKKSPKGKSAVMVSMVIEANDDGFLASVPGVQGAFAEGDTLEEAVFNCIDVLKLIFGYRTERGEPLGFNEVELTPETRMTVAIPVGCR